MKKEKTKTLAATDLVAGPDEVRQAIETLTEGERVKLDLIAKGAAYRLRRRAWATEAHDILNEAMLRVLQTKRHWKPERVDFVGLLVGTIKSIESDWRKRGKRGETPVLETDLSTTNSEGETMPNAIQQADDDRPNPERQVIEGEELTQEQLIHQIEGLFNDDSLTAFIFSEWQRGTKGPEIMTALDISRKEYDTAVRRMVRAIEKRWPEGMPHVR